MTDFYAETLTKLLQKGLIALDMRVLVLCGGKLDQETLARLGFKNVTISNVDVRMTGNEYIPFAWSFQDAENIAFKDNEFDFSIIHNGLHHCYSPHRGLLEAYRVAKRGLLVFEPRDNLASRLAVRSNFGQDYEVAAVFGNGYTYGGVRNTEIPNYVYRWTEREIQKTIHSCAPWGRHQFLFFYALRIPWERLRGLRNKFWLTATILGYPFLKCFTLVFPRQCNNFAFAVFKPRPPSDLHPWIKAEEGRLTINRDWVQQRYG